MSKYKVHPSVENGKVCLYRWEGNSFTREEFDCWAKAFRFVKNNFNRGNNED